MNSSDEILSEALRELAADSPRGAPAEVGIRVKGAFALHHARRRRNRIAFAVGVAACLLISFAWLRVGKLSHVEYDCEPGAGSRSTLGGGPRSGCTRWRESRGGG